MYYVIDVLWFKASLWTQRYYIWLAHNSICIRICQNCECFISGPALDSDRSLQFVYARSKYFESYYSIISTDLSFYFLYTCTNDDVMIKKCLTYCSQCSCGGWLLYLPPNHTTISSGRDNNTYVPGSTQGINITSTSSPSM